MQVFKKMKINDQTENGRYIFIGFANDSWTFSGGLVKFRVEVSGKKRKWRSSRRVREELKVKMRVKR